MRYSPYPAYEPSGVEWLGEIPEGWEVKRSRFCMGVNLKVKKLRELNPEDEVSFVPMEAVGEYGGLDLEITRQIGDIGSGYTEFQDGDVIVAKITPCFENGKGALAEGLQNGVAFGTTEVTVLRPLPTLERRFLFYLTISSAYRKTGEAEMYGAGGQKRVPPEFNKDFRTPLPPFPEQRAIVNFLDHQTTKIDTLVAKRRALIEKLKEKRTALISQTVTRGLPPDAARAAGLDPNPPLKPSDIEWLGDVPVGWTIVPLNRCMEKFFDFRGRTPKKLGMDWANEGIPAISASNVQMNKIDISSTNFGSQELYSKWMTLGDVHYGDVVMTSEAPLGKVAQIRDSQKYILSQRVVLIRGDPQQVENTYLKYFIMSPNFQHFLFSESTGSTAEGIKMSKFKMSPILLPSLPEQSAIADYLDRETAQIDQLVSLEEAVVERMQEYRSALITAAVTGKIDVRETIHRQDTGGVRGAET